MKQITQEEFDSLPVVDDVRQCPGYTDYSLIKSFGAWCSFENGRGACKTNDPVASFGFFGSNNRTTYAFNLDTGIWVRCGCFLGTLDEFRAQVIETHGETGIGKAYLGIVNLIEFRFSPEYLVNFQ